MRPRYRRPLATTNRFSVTFTTATPRSGSVTLPSGFTSRSRPGSAESGSATQRVPAGIAPTGAPLTTSLTNSSPASGPPSDALAAPAASPMRSSGSAPAAPPGPRTGARKGQPALATSARLASARLVQRRIELRDGEVDICVGMRSRDERGFEGGRREKDTARERGPMPPPEQRTIRPLGIGVVAHRSPCEVQAPQRARMAGGDGDLPL